MNQYISEILDVSDQANHLRLYLSGFISILDCVHGAAIDRLEIVSLLEPLEEGLRRIEQRTEESLDMARDEANTANYWAVKTKIQNRELKPTVNQLRKRYHLTKKTAAAYLLVMVNEGVIIERSGQYRLNK
jgi:hypothetical protein